MELDRGALLEREFTVRPGMNGSFVVFSHDAERVRNWHWGFSIFGDLLEFLRREGERDQGTLADETPEEQVERHKKLQKAW